MRGLRWRGQPRALTRRSLERRFATLVSQHRGAPFQIQRIRRDLSDLELDEESLSRELDARLKYLENLENDAFYIVLDTKKKTFAFHFGDRVVRQAALEVGSPRTIQSRSGSRWSFTPLTGAFSVKGKAAGASWRPPEWVYAMSGAPVPNPPQSILEGLGKYVIELSGGYVIHSPPPPESH